MFRFITISLFSALTLNAVLHAESDCREMHVVFAANNEQYLEGAMVAAASVLNYASAGDFYNFYIYTTEKLAVEGLAAPSKETLENLREQYRDQCKIDVLPIETLEEAECIIPRKCMNLRKWGIAGVLRIALPRLLPSIDRVIYMDCDMVAVKDLRVIDDLLSDHDEYAISGIIDIGASSAVGTLCTEYNQCDFAENEYINSGLLVMNLKRLRQEGFSSSVFSWLENHEAEYPDQDALNMAYKGKILVHDSTYAWPSCFSDAPENIAIVHFLAEHKPWKKGHYSNIYKRYLDSAPFLSPSKHFLLSNAASGNAQALSDFIKGKVVDVEVRDENGCTPLLLAAKSNAVEVVELLAAYGAELNVRDPHGRTPLIIATENNCYDSIKILMEHGANVHLIDNDGWTVNSWAQLPGNVAIRDLLESCNPELTDSSLLFEACEKGFTERVKVLLQHSINVNAANEKHLTPLIIAAKNGHIDIVQLLLDKGADSSLTDGGTWTALEWAKYPKIANFILASRLKSDLAGTFVRTAGHGLTQKIQALLDTGIDINVRDNNNITALIAAAQNGHADAVNVLLNNGADVSLTDGGTWRAFEWAIINRHQAVVDLLSKADKSNNLSSAFVQVIGNGFHEALAAFIDAGVDINARDHNNMTALIMAAQNGHVDAVNVLLNNGADVSLTDGGTWRAFEWAIINRHQAAVDLLSKADKSNNLNSAFVQVIGNGFHQALAAFLEAGADINARDNNNMTALIMAAKNGHIDAVKALIANEADVSLTDGTDPSLTDGGTWTALEWANLSKNTQIAELIHQKRIGASTGGVSIESQHHYIKSPLRFTELEAIRSVGLGISGAKIYQDNEGQQWFAKSLDSQSIINSYVASLLLAQLTKGTELEGSTLDIRLFSDKVNMIASKALPNFVQEHLATDLPIKGKALERLLARILKLEDRHEWNLGYLTFPDKWVPLMLDLDVSFTHKVQNSNQCIYNRPDNAKWAVSFRLEAMQSDEFLYFKHLHSLSMDDLEATVHAAFADLRASKVLLPSNEHQYKHIINNLKAAYDGLKVLGLLHSPEVEQLVDLASITAFLEKHPEIQHWQPWSLDCEKIAMTQGTTLEAVQLFLKAFLIKNAIEQGKGHNIDQSLKAWELTNPDDLGNLIAITLQVGNKKAIDGLAEILEEAPFRKMFSQYSHKNAKLMGQQILIAAIKRNEPKFVQFAIDKLHADKNLQDKNGNSPLILAESAGSLQIVNLLLDYKVDVNKQNQHGDTALILAVKHRQASIASRLQESGADVSIKNIWGETAAAAAKILEGNAKAVKLLQ